MGCGGSKSESARLPPLLRRRLDEIKARRNADHSTNLSKKELLKHRVHHEEDHSLSHYHSADETENDRKSVEGSVKPPAKVEEKKEDKADDSAEKKAMAPAKETDEEEKKGENNNGEDSEGEGRLSNSYLCPSSPSFRVYCVDQSSDNVKDDNENNNKYVEDESDRKSHGDESSEISTSVASNEELSKTKEKGKRGKRFRKVMGKRKPSGVKNLLKVKSCYRPSTSSHQDGTRLLAQNATG